MVPSPDQESGVTTTLVMISLRMKTFRYQREHGIIGCICLGLRSSSAVAAGSEAPSTELFVKIPSGVISIVPYIDGY